MSRTLPVLRSIPQCHRTNAVHRQTTRRRSRLRSPQSRRTVFRIRRARAPAKKSARGPRAAPRGWRGSHCDLRLDVRMRIVVLDFGILVAEGDDILPIRIEAHARQCARRPGQLQVRLLEMVEVEVRVAESVDKL